MNVSILVRSPVLRHGLETILGRLPNVVEVYDLSVGAGGAGGAVGAQSPGQADIIIVTSDESADIDDISVYGKKVLMLLDEAETRNPALAGSVCADGFLILQEVSAEILSDALERIMVGEMPIPARLGRRLLVQAGSQQAFGRPRPLSLTARENETLLLLADGLSNKQIARRLRISEHGAKRLVTSVLLKLGAANRTAAVVTAIKAGMIDCTGDKNAVCTD